MTKRDLIDEIVRLYPAYSRRDAEVIVNAVFDSMTDALCQGERIEIRGFGSFVVVYVVIMAPALVGMIALAWWARETEAHVLRMALTDAADRGLLPATDIGWVVDLRARRDARRHARRHGGPDAERAMRDYQQAAIELGFLHHRLLRGTAPRDWQARGQDFLARIQAARPRIAFPGQVVPQR